MGLKDKPSILEQVICEAFCLYCAFITEITRFTGFISPIK